MNFRLTALLFAVALVLAAGPLVAVLVACTPVAVQRSDLDALFKAGGGSGKAWQLAKWLPDYRQKRLLGAELRDPVADLKAVKITRGKQELALARSDAGEWNFTAPTNYGL